MNFGNSTPFRVQVETDRVEDILRHHSVPENIITSLTIRLLFGGFHFYDLSTGRRSSGFYIRDRQFIAIEAGDLYCTLAHDRSTFYATAHTDRMLSSLLLHELRHVIDLESLALEERCTSHDPVEYQRLHRQGEEVYLQTPEEVRARRFEEECLHRYPNLVRIGRRLDYTYVVDRSRQLEIIEESGLNVDDYADEPTIALMELNDPKFWKQCWFYLLEVFMDHYFEQGKMTKELRLALDRFFRSCYMVHGDDADWSDVVKIHALVSETTGYSKPLPRQKCARVL